MTIPGNLLATAMAVMPHVDVDRTLGLILDGKWRREKIRVRIEETAFPRTG